MTTNEALYLFLGWLVGTVVSGWSMRLFFFPRWRAMMDRADMLGPGEDR